MLAGTVTGFDAAKGLGTVTSASGQEYLFHVIEIADGSRAIDIGQPVLFQPLPKFGHHQAGSIHKV